MSLRIQRRLNRWGHAYGLRVTRSEARRLGVKEKSPVEFEVRPLRGLDVKRLHFVRLGRDASMRHDEIAAEESRAGR